MIRVNVICEGSTEEQFVRNVLYDHFIHRGIILNSSSIGGISRYPKLKNEIMRWLNDDQEAYVTTMVDLYGMNNSFPGYTENRINEAIGKVEAVEEAASADILASRNLHNQKFIPYFQLHEFEALLFSDPTTMQEWLSLDHDIPENCFTRILEGFDSPEHINDSSITAPSKRIINHVPSYEKIDEGITIVQEIGLEKIRKECPHFNDWLIRLENLGTTGNNPEEE